MPEAEILNSSIDKLQFNHLMPGMMLYASPLKIVSDGAFVEIGNGEIFLVVKIRYDFEI